MNLHWTNLTASQRQALMMLCSNGPSTLPDELGEQLCNLGLAERTASSGYCISALGMTVPPATLN
ncbi:hypothetical protein [Devosia rhizoryzae]|uniref:Uncharacterized protein n=1 Tax=Devosia rhizoryzae TaxID=2774137 RepID=A0ABX7C842_9HYPH|nr:hypothetical protein [Devosia rhizoryzae]QQR40428.1 hypothetical protein JI748_05350 [Devosia rhizoryzae]